MVSMTASINAGDVARFNSALKEYADSLGKDMATAPRRAAIQMCRSFRKGTKSAKKNKGMSVAISTESPKWITYKDGKKLAQPLRRWSVTLTDRGKTFTRFVYAGTRAEMKKQLRQQVGINYWPISAGKAPAAKGGHRGLAKQSWGWVMHNIFNGSAPDTPWKRRKRDKRNPKDATRESTSSSRNGTLMSSGFARISNRLDYISDALKISVDDAIGKATNWILKQVERRRPKV